MVTKGYGFTIDDIDWSCPADLEPYAKAHKTEIKEQDSLMWNWWGNYGLLAVTMAVERNLAGQKAKLKYMEKPYMEMTEDEMNKAKNDRPEYIGLTDDEKQQAELEKAKDYFNSLLARF